LESASGFNRNLFGIIGIRAPERMTKDHSCSHPVGLGRNLAALGSLATVTTPDFNCGTAHQILKEAEMVELHHVPTGLTMQTEATAVSAVYLTLVVVGLIILLLMVVVGR
jgi:hypothetical protein